MMDDFYQGWLPDFISWLTENSYSSYFCVKTFFVTKPIVSLTLSSVLCYFIWYRTCAVRKPSLHCKEGPLKRYLLEHCTILTERYWPTWWAVNCHMCTILRSALQKFPNNQNAEYERHKLVAPDGGIVPLDFGCNYSFSPSSPVLLILPGLTGDCYMNYILHFVEDAYKTGYRPVVFNQRGTAGVPLETARLYSATNTEDLQFVIEYIKSIYPTADIVAIGVSLGGIILSRYICDSGTNCLLTAAITFSTPLHPASSKFSLENKWFNKRVYIDYLVLKLKEIVEKNSHVLERHPSIDVKRVRRANSLSEFDRAITAPLFGYKSEVDYYADACLVNKICNIAIPYIAIVAEDDPFVPKVGYPVDKFYTNPNTFLISTKHGGHFGFLEGAYPNGMAWMNRVHRELLESLRVFCSM